ncbi:hypothetical protein RB595_004834 [Gaeumannomyces hyphopodioides]
MHFITIAQVAATLALALPAFALPVLPDQAMPAPLSRRQADCQFGPDGKLTSKGACKFVATPPKKVMAGTLWLPGKSWSNPKKLPTGGDGSMYGKRDEVAEQAKEAEEEADLE